MGHRYEEPFHQTCHFITAFKRTARVSDVIVPQKPDVPHSSDASFSSVRITGSSQSTVSLLSLFLSHVTLRHFLQSHTGRALGFCVRKRSTIDHICVAASHDALELFSMTSWCSQVPHSSTQSCFSSPSTPPHHEPFPLLTLVFTHHTRWKQEICLSP